MSAPNPIGALMFVRYSLTYGQAMPVYRHRTKQKHQAFVLADSKDAEDYAIRHNLVLVDRDQVKP